MNLDQIDISLLTYFKRDGKLRFKLPTKQGLILKTKKMVCRNGIGENMQFTVEIPNTMSSFLNRLDLFIKQVAEKEASYLNLTGDLYRSFIKEDTLKLYISKFTKVFDKNKVIIPPSEYSNLMTNRFSCLLLLDFSNLTVFADMANLRIGVLQVMILDYCILPEGCTIFKSEQEFTKAIENASQSTPLPLEDTAVTDFDPNINELID